MFWFALVAVAAQSQTYSVYTWESGVANTTASPFAMAEGVDGYAFDLTGLV